MTSIFGAANRARLKVYLVALWKLSGTRTRRARRA